jgi:hypothetical protein
MKKELFSTIIGMLLLTVGTSMIVKGDWSTGDDYIMHFPQLPDPTGWAVDGTYTPHSYPQIILADDWMCTETSTVSDIHFWGSWQDDLVGSITAFDIAIYSDEPANPTTLFSQPDEKLWERTFYPGDWVQAGPWTGTIGWYHPVIGTSAQNNHFTYWQYNIEDIDNPFVQENNTIYWLAITAIIRADQPQPRWGWMSSTDHWNDNAVNSYLGYLDWYELEEPPDFNTALDFSFVINGDVAPLNHPPNIPSKLSGPSNGEVGQRYSFSTQTTDPDGDRVRYGIDYTSDGLVDFWSTSYQNSGSTYTINLRFLSTGTYYLRVKAEDIYGAQSDYSLVKTIVIVGVNNPPNIPNPPLGPTTGFINEALTFSTSSTDPESDQIKYGWDWNGDGTVDEWSGFLSSGATDSRSHTFTTAGTYQIQVKAEDINGSQSAFSTALTVIITANSPPLQPSISGPSSGRVQISYTFNAVTTDIDGDNLSYWFDWGDGPDTHWKGPYASGSIASESHSWDAQGSYIVKVKVKDEHGSISVWSDPLPISMPKNKSTTIVTWISQFLEQHPRLQLLLTGVH